MQHARVDISVLTYREVSGIWVAQCLDINLKAASTGLEVVTVKTKISDMIVDCFLNGEDKHLPPASEVYFYGLAFAEADGPAIPLFLGNGTLARRTSRVYVQFLNIQVHQLRELPS